MELPALLGVDLLHCERAAREAVAEEEEGGEDGVKESGGGLQLIGDGSELVSRAYLDAVVGEVGELLRGGAGAVSLADLCARFALGADVLTRLLEGATARSSGEAAAGPQSPLLEARLDGGFLVTAAAAARARAALRGALRGATAPVQLSALAKSLGIDPRVLAGAGGASGGGGGLAAVVEGLVRSGEVRGALRGGGASFAPELHSRAVAAASAAFYAQNGYVEVSGGGSGANTAASLPEGAVLLPSGAVAAAPALVAQVEAAVEDAAASVSSSSAADPSSPLWVDVSSLGVIPAALSRGDARALLLRAPAAEKLLLAAKGALAAAAAAVPVPDSQSGSSSASPRPPPLLLAGTCVVSGAMLLSLRERARELALAEAAKVISEGKRAKASSSSSAKAAASASDVAPATAAAAAASNASKGPKTGDGDDDEDWSMGGKSKKKGGAAGKKNKGGGGASSSSRAGLAAAASKKATISTSSSPSDAALSLAALAEAVERWHPGTSESGIGGGGEDGDEDGDEEDEAGEGRRQRSSSLAWALAALLRPVALAAFDAAVADAASSGADSRKKSREALLAAAVDAGDRLQLYARGAEALAAVGGKPGGGGDRGGSGGDAAAAAASAAAAEAISRHLILRGPGVEAADALLRVLAFDAAADEGGAGGGEKSPFAELPQAEGKGAPFAPPLSPSERAALVASLPPTGSSSSRAEAAALVDALTSSDVPALVDALEAATAAAGSRFRRLERKAEKALAAAARRSLEDALKKETSPAAALPLAASVALARLRPGRAVPPVPGRALGFLLGALASALAKEEEGGGGSGDGGDGEEKGDASSSASSSSSAAAVTALFKKFHGLVVASLKSSGEGENGSSEQLEALLPSLKRAALGEKEDGE